MASIECGPCLEENKSSAAVRFCSDCEDHLCKNCTEHHFKFKALKSHHLVEIYKASIFMSTIKKYCNTHEDVLLDYFCTQHDTVCCRLCIPTSHQSCQTILPLDIAAKDMKNSAIKKDTMSELANIKETLEKLLDNRNSNLKHLEQTESVILKQVGDVKNEMISHINKLEQDIVTRLSTLMTENKTEIKKQMMELYELSIAVMKSEFDFSNLIDHGSANQLFLSLHQQKDGLLKKVRQLQESLQSIHNIDIVFQSERDYKPASLGTISESKRPVDVQYRPIHIQQAQVTAEPQETFSTFKPNGHVYLKRGLSYNVTGIAVTKENKLLVCNFLSLHKLVFVYKDCQYYEGEIDFLSDPYGIAIIPGRPEAIITCPKTNYIQFVNSLTIAKGRTITVGEGYYGIHVTKEQIVIGGINNITILDMNGTKLQIVDLPLYNKIYSVTLRQEKLEVICRSNENICCFKFDGTLVYKYDAKCTESGIAVDKQHNVYVCGRDTKNIYRLTADGTFRDNVLTCDDGILRPNAICFSTDFSRLFVVNECQSIVIFTSA